MGLVSVRGLLIKIEGFTDQSPGEQGGLGFRTRRESCRLLVPLEAESLQNPQTN